MTESVSKWLTSADLGAFNALFEEHQIDLEAARDLTEDDLRELGIAMGPRKKLLRAIADLQAVGVDEEASSPQTTQSRQTGAEGGQRRQVTVLFADISGFTELSSTIDAEETHALLKDYFEIADDIVRRHGGTVDKHIGDSVMGIFGAPVAYGNEAERAMSAANAIHAAMSGVSERLGRQLAVHIGLASGQVVASAFGEDEQFTVIGDSVNLAARLTDKAKAGETIVSAGVRGALPVSAEFGPVQTLALKGFEAPVEAYLVTDNATSGGLGTARTPLVGRNRELSQFRVVLEDCLQTREGQLVCLRGEAGIGKTRLAEELSSIAASNGFETHRTLVLDFGTASNQDAPRGLVRSLLGLAADADETSCASAAHAALDKGLVARDDIVHLNNLLDIAQPDDLRALHDAMDSGRRRRGRSEALATLVTAVARHQPLFLLVEDVHWAEARTLESIAEICRRISDAPVMLTVTTRVEGDPLHGLQRTGLGSTALTTFDLRALRPDEAVALASGFDEASQEYVKLCVERAEGNPLFLEQLLRNAETAGFSAVPDNVQSIVQARMDALDTPDHEALEAASVMGQRFVLKSLQQLLDQPDFDPSELVARHLVQPDGDRFLFTHALVRDGVYASILRSRLRALHKKAANILGVDDPTLRARHLDLAEDGAAPAAYLDAARIAADALEEEAVLGHCERGLEISEDLEISSEFMRLRGNALRNLGRTEESIQAFEHAAEAAEQASDVCLALIGLAEGLRVVDRHADVLAVLERAEASDETMPDALRARVHYLRGSVCFPMGDIEGCLAGHQKSLDLARQAGSPEAEASALSGLGDAHYLQGLMQDAREQFDACVAISRAHDLGRIEVANRHMVGWSRIHMLEFRGALQDGIECANMAARVGNRRAEQAALLLAGRVQHKLGDLEAAEALLQQGLELCESIGAAGFSINSLAFLAETQRERGELAKARQTIGDAIERLRTVGRSFIGPTTFAVAASVEPDPKERRRLISVAEDIIAEGCVSHNQFWFADIAFNVELDDGEWDAVERHAERLEAYTRRQPLASSDYLVARARVLSAIGQGQSGGDLKERTSALLQTAANAGLVSDAKSLEAGLQKLG